jgi:hypothetical protein
MEHSRATRDPHIAAPGKGLLNKNRAWMLVEDAGAVGTSRMQRTEGVRYWPYPLGDVDLFLWLFQRRVTREDSNLKARCCFCPRFKDFSDLSEQWS